MNEQTSIQIDEPTLLRTYPQLKALPKDHLQIVILTIAGMGPNAVSDTVGVTRQTVWNVLQKYNIAAIISDSMGLQRMLLANSLGSMAVDALAALTQKRDELKKMSASSLLEFINKCLTMSDTIRPKDSGERKSAKQLLEQLKEEDGTHIQS